MGAFSYGFLCPTLPTRLFHRNSLVAGSLPWLGVLEQIFSWVMLGSYDSGDVEVGSPINLKSFRHLLLCAPPWSIVLHLTTSLERVSVQPWKIPPKYSVSGLFSFAQFCQNATLCLCGESQNDGKNKEIEPNRHKGGRLRELCMHTCINIFYRNTQWQKHPAHFGPQPLIPFAWHATCGGSSKV